MKEELKLDARELQLKMLFDEQQKQIEQHENKIADIKANCDLAIEGRDVKIMELEQQIEKMKTELDNARESANRQEQREIYSVLNDIYNDNFE